jgi:lipopolysaccharide/colanic/teichoic acid biosynthesis glycosyltransferase
LKLYRSRLWRAVVGEVPPSKRLLDISGAVTLIIALAPLLLILAVNALRDSGRVLFWETRVGRRGRCFACPRFRTGVADNRFDRIVRRFGMDCLPRLWCVLSGDMSLVGPQPALPTDVDRYTHRDLRRLAVAPGLTGSWLVEGREAWPFVRIGELDLQYVDGRSLWLDITLLLRTPRALLCGNDSLERSAAPSIAADTMSGVQSAAPAAGTIKTKT